MKSKNKTAFLTIVTATIMALGAVQGVLDVHALFLTSTTTTLFTSNGVSIPTGGSVPLGTSFYDNATVSGLVPGIPITGSVTYTIYRSSDCSGFSRTFGPVPVGSPSATSAPRPAETDSFKATYNGDSNYGGSTSSCESLTVLKGLTTVTTTLFTSMGTSIPSGGSVALGSSVYENATVSGTVPGIPMGGVLIFFFFNNAACSSTGSLAGYGFPPFPPFQPSITEGPLAAGSYSFNAQYSGDINYNPAVSSCEAFTVNNVRISVSKFFTDSSLNPLQLDSHGNPRVDVVLARGIVESTNPGQVLAWVNVTNTGTTPLQSLKLNETLPLDWAVSPAWMPARGAIHAYFANTTSLVTNPEITDPNTITVTNGNPQTVILAIPSLNATAIGHPLMPGLSILLSVKLSYGLIKTGQSFTSYPRDYTDTASAIAWTQPSYMGASSSATGSAFFIANVKVDGDPSGPDDFHIILVSKNAVT